MWDTHRDSPLNDLFEGSLMAFEGELAHLMDAEKDTHVERVIQQDDIRSLVRDNGKIRPPFFTYRLGDSTLNEEGVAPEKTQRWGVLRGGPKSHLTDDGEIVDPNVAYQRLGLVPTIVNINVNLYCSQRIQILFMKKWTILSVRPLVFELEYKGFVVRFRAILDKSITFSDTDSDKDNLTICQTNVMLYTYVSQDSEVKPITRYTLRESVPERDENEKRKHRRLPEGDLVFSEDGVERTTR